MKTKRMSLYIVSVVLLVIMIVGSLGLATWALLSTKLDVSGNIGFQGTGDVLATISDGKVDGTKLDGKMNGFEIKADSETPTTARASWTNLNDLAFADNSKTLVISFSVTNNQPEGGKNLKIDVDASIPADSKISIAVTTTEFKETNPVVIAPQAVVNYQITFTVGETNTTLSSTFSVENNLVNTDEPASVAPTIYTREGNYIYFGSYAKSIKANDVTVSPTADADGYFTGSDGEKYVKITATPNESGYTFSDNTTITEGTEYYFKVEPIKWRILKEENGSAMILAEDILEKQAYKVDYEEHYYAGNFNYANSDIRAWLNGAFLTTAFTNDEKGIIQTIEVDNSAASTDIPYDPDVPTNPIGPNTNDKVYLLSYQDLCNKSYGFPSDYPEGTDPVRAKAPTDYAKATGVYVVDGVGIWWSRSVRADANGGPYVWYVDDSGRVDMSLYPEGWWTLDEYNFIYHHAGAVPALTITL